MNLKKKKHICDDNKMFLEISSKLVIRNRHKIDKKRNKHKTRMYPEEGPVLRTLAAPFPLVIKVV